MIIVEIQRFLWNNNILVSHSLKNTAYALDAVHNPRGLYEPIFTDSGDTLYVMDQSSNMKNKKETRGKHLSLSEAMKDLNSRAHEIISLCFFAEKT